MINADRLKKIKDLLDAGAITQEEFEQQKALIFAENKKSKFPEKLKLGIGIFAIVIICFSIIGAFIPESEDANVEKEVVNKETVSSVKEDIPKEFSGECPVLVEASMYDNIIGVPELECSIRNKVDKEISAIKLYFSPKDVYGEDVDSIFTTNQLYTDEPISPNGSVSRSWQMLDQDVKSGDVYIYSVYFSDGTEWGNKDAATSDIKKYGYKINAKY